MEKEGGMEKDERRRSEGRNEESPVHCIHTPHIATYMHIHQSISLSSQPTYTNTYTQTQTVSLLPYDSGPLTLMGSANDPGHRG
jgi:hypothetical protein